MRPSQSSMPGAPPRAPVLTRELSDNTTVRIFQFPDRSYRLTLDTCFKQEGEQRFWKHRELNGRDLPSLLVGLLPTTDQSTIKEIIEQCSNQK